MANKNLQRKGFTLVELSMAITFMSVLMLGILYVTIQAGKIYAKGLTYKSVNQVSREVVDSVRRDFLAASASGVVTPAPLGATDAKTGRMCTGAVSYVWNTAALLGTTGPQIKDNTTPVVFRRVVDPGGALCVQTSPGTYSMAIGGMESKELLSTNGSELAVYSLDVSKLKSDERRGLYKIHVVMGTNQQGTTQKESIGYTCKPPADNTANFEYCTVVEFDIIVRAGGNT